MGELLKKDFTLAVTGLKQDLLLIGIFILLSIFMSNSSYPMDKNIGLMLFYFILFGNIQHEQCFQCTKLILSIPCSRTNYVISKYILGYISLGITISFNFVLCYLLSLLKLPGFSPYTSFELYSYIFGVLLFMSIAIPFCLIIHYNFTKWISVGFMIFIISFAPILLDNSTEIIAFINKITITPTIVLTLALIISILSMLITIICFKKKDF